MLEAQPKATFFLQSSQTFQNTRELKNGNMVHGNDFCGKMKLQDFAHAVEFALGISIR